MVTTPFRTPPVLGPDLHQTSADAYYDTIAGPTITGAAVAPSYQLGTTVTGNDGHSYTHVTAAANLAADARVNINEATWVATANGTGTHMAPVAVLAGQAFQARKFVL